MRWRIVVLVVTIAAAACGGGPAGDPASPSPPAVPTASSAPAATPEPSPPAGEPAAPATTAGPVLGPFEITTSDGLILEAERFGTGDDFVVLAHMRPADMSSWSSFAGLLAGEGYSVIIFNFRGYGNSEGSGFTVDTDVVAAVDAAFALGARSVAVIGASMGGTGAIAAAAQRDLAAVVTLSAPAEFEGTDALSAAERAQTGMLLVAAEEDSPYEDHAELLRARAGGFAEVAIFAGDKHGTDMFRDHSEALTQAILRFLAET